MFLTYLRKEWHLSVRNFFIVMIALFPLLFSWATLALTTAYSPYPKIVVLAGQAPVVNFPEQVSVEVAATAESLRARVSDIDTAIGVLPNKQLVIDGREGKEAVEQAKALVQGKLHPATEEARQTRAVPFFAFALYSSFLAGGILLFKLVEEREYQTIDLLKTQPVPQIVPLAAKMAIVSLLAISGFLFSLLILGGPLRVGDAALLLLVGVPLCLLLGLCTAYYATNQAQAIALLKPVITVVIILLPLLGLLLGGIMHTIALFNPFYWLLQAIYGYYLNQPITAYLLAISGFVIISSILIVFTWHKSPYAIQQAE
ncbi:ABC transporter permease [Brevibacillus humidisoli]|uniref:ABC transporter permease n=1 Tax=Brevibacillus humidisoli TaxID=2895522 RepID=UPI001E3D9152|nr:ABC transporter permease [Brevibacillus humidisoli]UFJ41371.1 ABC transporter permease [Brevibacillus humidisoli]